MCVCVCARCTHNSCAQQQIQQTDTMYSAAIGLPQMIELTLGTVKLISPVAVIDDGVKSGCVHSSCCCYVNSLNDRWLFVSLRSSTFLFALVPEGTLPGSLDKPARRGSESYKPLGFGLSWLRPTVIENKDVTVVCVSLFRNLDETQMEATRDVCTSFRQERSERHEEGEQLNWI